MAELNDAKMVAFDKELMANPGNLVIAVSDFKQSLPVSEVPIV
jgi:hypothetical protein